MSSDVAISVDNVSKCYQIFEQPHHRLLQMLARGRRRFYKEFWALHEISFDVRRGESVGVIGRNGSGKSTLLQLISGTLAATCGHVHTQGRVAALLELGSGFNPEFTGRENVYLNGAVLGLDRTEIDERFSAIEAFADIGDFIDQPVKTYSSGMVVRLAFAVSVCVDPDILIVDEALAVGDAAFQFKCLERLKELIGSGVTLLFVSHDISMVKNFCSRVIYLEQGRVKAVGPAEQVAELYILALRDAQQAQLVNGGQKMIRKRHLNGDEHVAFGTGQGQILDAWFEATKAKEAAFVGGECARVMIRYEFDESLCGAHVCLVVQNHRMVELGGKYFPVSGVRGESGRLAGEIKCDMPVELGAGNYFITVKLETRSGELDFLPVDKQPGLLSFSVYRAGQDFVGPANLCIASVG